MTENKKMIKIEVVKKEKLRNLMLFFNINRET